MRDPFAPLEPHPEIDCGAAINFYGECVNYLGMFGQTRLGQTMRNEVSRHKSGGQSGFAIDTSVTPNRVVTADYTKNRILGWRYLGTCASGQHCTWDSECGDGSSCILDSLRDADIKFPDEDDTNGACNSDDYRGVRGPAARDTLCFFNTPDNSNKGESYTGIPLTFDEDGNLYAFDKYNGRGLEWLKPFDTDVLADDWWGQDDWSGHLQNQGMPEGTVNDVALWPVRQPHRAFRGVPAIEPDGGGGVWIGDPGNYRLVHAPAGSHRFDVCLGAPDCFTVNPAVWPGCFQGSGEQGMIQDTSLLCSAMAARVHPVTGELWVADAGRDGWSGNYGGSISIYTPPFASGQSPRKRFRPNLATLTRMPGGATQPYSFRPFDLRADPVELGARGMWVLDHGWNGGLQRGLLLDEDGNVLDVIGSTAPDVAFDDWGSCGNPMTYYSWWNSQGFDVSKGGIVGGGPAVVSVNEFPFENWTAPNGVTCPPASTGGMYENNNWWGLHTPASLDAPVRVDAKAGQLIAPDFNWGKTKVWNGYTGAAWGAPPAFELTEDRRDPLSMPARGSFSQADFDGAGNYWLVGDRGLDQNYYKGASVFAMPLTPDSRALNADGHLYWADDPGGAPIELDTSPTQHVLYDHVRDRLVIADSLGARIFGVSNYRDVLADPTARLLVDWVWPDTDKVGNGCNPDGPPTAHSLCDGGPLAITSAGDLFVQDMAGHNWDTACGNNRVLGLLTSDLNATRPAPGSVVFANFDAKRIIRPGGPNYNAPGLCGVYQASRIVFDSHDRLWMSGHGGTGYAPTPYSFWELTVYDNPIVSDDQPDYLVRIPQGYVPGLGLDRDNGNILIGGASFAQILVINTDRDPGWLTPLP